MSAEQRSPYPSSGPQHSALPGEVDNRSYVVRNLTPLARAWEGYYGDYPPGHYIEQPSPEAFEQASDLLWIIARAGLRLVPDDADVES